MSIISFPSVWPRKIPEPHFFWWRRICRAAAPAVITKQPAFLTVHRGQTCNRVMRQITHDSCTQHLPGIVKAARHVVGAHTEAASTPLVCSETIEDPHDIQKTDPFGRHTKSKPTAVALFRLKHPLMRETRQNLLEVVEWDVLRGCDTPHAGIRTLRNLSQAVPGPGQRIARGDCRSCTSSEGQKTKPSISDATKDAFDFDLRITPGRYFNTSLTLFKCCHHSYRRHQALGLRKSRILRIALTSFPTE